MLTVQEKLSLVVGFKQVKKAILEGSCKKILIADDCNPTMTADIKSIAENIEIITLPTMCELGKLCEIDVGASCACVK